MESGIIQNNAANGSATAEVILVYGINAYFVMNDGEIKNNQYSATIGPVSWGGVIYIENRNINLNKGTISASKLLMEEQLH